MFLRFFFILLIAFTNSASYGQNQVVSSFIVLTFEENYSKGVHGRKLFYWVSPLDSITSIESKLYGFYEGYFSKSSLSDCCSSERIDPTIPSIKQGDYDFGKGIVSNRDSLRETVRKKRILIQTISKKWASKKMSVKIYATPIKAELCSCMLLNSSESRFNYSDLIFLPYNFVGFFPDFWNSEKATLVLNRDFATFDYKKLTFPTP